MFCMPPLLFPVFTTPQLLKPSPCTLENSQSLSNSISSTFQLFSEFPLELLTLTETRVSPRTTSLKPSGGSCVTATALQLLDVEVARCPCSSLPFETILNPSLTSPSKASLFESLDIRLDHEQLFCFSVMSCVIPLSFWKIFFFLQADLLSSTTLIS